MSSPYQLAAGRIVQRVERPDAEVVTAFASYYTGIVLDSMRKSGAMSVDLAPLAPGTKVCGPAVTCFGADLSIRRMAIDLAEPGDVLVVAAGGIRDRACFGDGTAKRMTMKSMAGAVVDGAVRDAAGLRDLGFPTFCLGTTPRNYHYPMEAEEGAVNVPVICGGVLVEPGDLILGDDDGVVVVPRALAPEIRHEVAAKLAAEREVRGSWTGYEPFDVVDELKQRGYVFE
ncbi:RraA family protein [Streptomyces hydrogenans]|uniref:RraA family protein n=1 Tax=Streptomyces hydrogenans TaxID=1873719 RepID=UPI00364FCC39